jgi:hypothetical protein
LKPYENVYKNIQGVLFYRRPVVFGVVIAVVELLFILIGCADLGFLSVVSLALALYYVGKIAYLTVGQPLVASAFGPIDEGAPTTSNRIYELLPFCQRISHISSTLVDALEKVHDANRAGSIPSLAICSIVFAVLFFFFSVCGSLWPVFVLVHIILLAPGIVMHPAVFPYTEPYILKFAKAINCPYCQPKTD